MTRVLKIATAAVLTGAIAIAVATPSEARNGRTVAAAGIGFAAGAVIGAAAANAANSSYYYGPGYYYSEPAYAYEPAYVYEAAPVYVEPAPRYYRSYGPRSGCWHVTDSDRGFGYYGHC